MLAYQQQQQQQQQPVSVVAATAAESAGSGSASTAPTVAATMAKPRLGNHGIGSWNAHGDSRKAENNHHPSPKSFASSSAYRLHAVNDSSALSRSQQDSRGNHRSGNGNGNSDRNNQVAFAAPHWRNYHNHYQQQQHHHQHQIAPAGSYNNRRSARRTANAANINQQWRSTTNPATGANTNSNPNRLSINTAKAINNRDVAPFMSSTFQGTESPLLSGISLALSKQKQQYQPDTMVPPVKVIPALYDVAQPRTPHPLSPADSLKTPGYIDPESLPFELGSTITDSGTAKQYKLLSVLGEGSYAVVYLARCSRDGAKYALKCLSKLGLTARQLSLQRSELEIHSSVCPHPHIVTLYSHFETRDWLFLVMERVSGPDLYDYITQHPAFNANQEERRFVEATRLFEQMIDAVAHIHALKAYHRDLKPENFILGADGNLKLTDFGLATREPLSTDFECGSKPYMSYENRNGGLNPNDPTVYGPRDDYSPRLSDVWALGVLFLNLLFAQSPWTDPSRESCFKFCQFLREGAGFLVGQFPKLPREVADFLVTRVFSPESGRCNVLEFKQWVQALGYPFNPPKPGAAVPRPINSRHKASVAGRRAGGSGGGSAGKSLNSGSAGKKWSPINGSYHSLTKPHHMPHPAQPTTAVALDSAVVVTNASAAATAAAALHADGSAAPYAKPKSPQAKPAPPGIYISKASAAAATSAQHGAALPGAQNGGSSMLNVHHMGKHNLSTSVPALVFSQIIPATQAAAARKMMPREQNQTAAKAAAAILQSSMLCLPKNGLGQGKEDDSKDIVFPLDDDNEGHSSWNQLDDLSEAEDEDEDEDEDERSDVGYRAAAAVAASKFPMQTAAGSFGVSLAKSAIFDSDEEMDFSAPLSFEDSHHIETAAPKSLAADKPAPPTTIPQPPSEPAAVVASSTLDSSSFSDDFDVLGHFSDEDDDSSANDRTSTGAPGPAQSTSRVRFSNIPQPPAILPLARNNIHADAPTNSADSSLTATLVTSSVEYYSPKMVPAPGTAAGVNRKSGSPQNIDDADGGIDADDEADGRWRQHKAINSIGNGGFSASHKSRVPAAASGSAPRNVHFGGGAAGSRYHQHQHRHGSGKPLHKLSLPAKSTRSPVMQHSMPAPINALVHKSALMDEQTSFSWADDADELPIPSLAAQIANATVGDTAEEALSDELSWPVDDDHNQLSDDMFAMEL